LAVIDRPVDVDVDSVADRDVTTAWSAAALRPSSRQLKGRTAHEKGHRVPDDALVPYIQSAHDQAGCPVGIG
jgi:hypothetical protein